MKKKLTAGLALGLLVIGGMANADVLTFDDVIGANPNDTNNVIYDGYGGFDWDQMYVLHQNNLPDSGYDRGVVSGDWVAYNAFDNIATVNDSTFDFNGAFFTSAWDASNSITANGYLNGQLLYTNTLGINNQSPSWLQFDFFGIDSLTLSSSGSHFAMDNFTFNEQQPVPEPATLLLMGTGLAGLAGSRLRRKKQV